MKQQMKRSEFFPVPSAHETWVRNRIPRGAHYDPADDGPEVDVCNAHFTRAAFEFLDGIEEKWERAFEAAERFVENWLNVGPSWPPDGDVDILDHRRE